jgi:hypothetical protein
MAGCGPTTCSGCCSGGGNCYTSRTESHCFTTGMGMACDSCSGSRADNCSATIGCACGSSPECQSGQHCTGSVCYNNDTGPCGACTGCCVGTTMCLPGTAQSACGKDGKACESCGGDQCSNQSCED